MLGFEKEIQDPTAHGHRGQNGGDQDGDGQLRGGGNLLALGGKGFWCCLVDRLVGIIDWRVAERAKDAVVIQFHAQLTQ